jgi:hypothetical protein
MLFLNMVCLTVALAFVQFVVGEDVASFCCGRKGERKRIGNRGEREKGRSERWNMCEG